jgi:Lrp/AsnC family leucine-responsive transcriptional regulator
MAELGRRIETSAPAVTERVQRIERLGVITGYRLETGETFRDNPTSFSRGPPGRGSVSSGGRRAVG